MGLGRILMVGSLLTLVTGPMPQAQESCMLIEVQVISVDEKGEMHFLANFEQILTAGEVRTTMLDVEEVTDGKLEAKVTWPSFPGEVTPRIDLNLSAQDEVVKSSVAGSVRLEKLLWDALFGPEPFKSKKGSTMQLGKLGHAFAVAGVAPNACGSPLKE